VVFIDMAHAHSRDALATVSHIRQQRTTDVQIIAGNVVTPEAARSLVDAGADAVAVGIGAKELSASRRLAGVGMPQLKAILDVVEQCQMMSTPVIVDGGIYGPADLAKAIGAGAESVIIGWLFSGSDEAPGEIIQHGGNVYKIVNPTAKPQHRPPFSSAPSSDPCRLDDDLPDTSIPYRGSVEHMVNHLIKGLKAAMAYTGSEDIRDLIEKAEFVKK
jgi:IMP dehydrogenase